MNGSSDKGLLGDSGEEYRLLALRAPQVAKILYISRAAPQLDDELPRSPDLDLVSAWPHRP